MSSRIGTLLVVALLTACGYRFIGGADNLPAGVTTLWAPMAVNKTPEPGFEVTFTEYLRQRMMRAGVLSGPGSSAEVQSEISTTGTGPALVRNVDGGVGYASYRVSATVKLSLVRNGEVLRKAESSNTEDFLPDANSDPLALEAARKAALDRLAEMLARDAFERLANP